MTNTRTRGWCITAFENEFKQVSELLKTADYGIYGNETCPTTGRKHMQCYGYWANKISFNEIKRWLPTAHIEASKGNPIQNRAYCAKDNDFIEHGDLPSQGRRTDIADFRDAILEGMSEENLIMEYPNMMAKYDRFYQRCRNLVLRKEAKKIEAPEVTVLIGNPGIGKTRHIYDNENHDDIYKVEVGDGSSGSVFWDGYNGESVILIDDFHSNIKLDYMLRLLDRYPMKLNIKGNYTWKCAKRIYITSNISIDKWYPNCPEIHRKALTRRITQTINL